MSLTLISTVSTPESWQPNRRTALRAALDPLLASEDLKKRWCYFIRKVYETDPLTCPKCQREMRIISFIDQPDVIQNILEHLALTRASQTSRSRQSRIGSVGAIDRNSRREI